MDLVTAVLHSLRTRGGHGLNLGGCVFLADHVGVRE